MASVLISLGDNALHAGDLSQARRSLGRATALMERRPELKVLYLSGYTATIIDSRTDMGARDELLAKPFTRAELLRRVRRALDGAGEANSGTAQTPA